MNLDEFTERYFGCLVTFKGEGITTTNEAPLAKPIAENQRIILDAYQDVHDIPYVTMAAQALGGILPMHSLTFSQASLVIRKGVELLRAKEAIGADIPPEDRPILPDQTLRLHHLKDERGSPLINIRASEVLGEEGVNLKLNGLTRGQAEKIIDAVVFTPRTNKPITQRKRWPHERT